MCYLIYTSYNISDAYIHQQRIYNYIRENLIDRISEPYMTTRENGTGLGLAIATKIMEDHNKIDPDCRMTESNR